MQLPSLVIKGPIHTVITHIVQHKDGLLYYSNQHPIFANEEIAEAIIIPLSDIQSAFPHIFVPEEFTNGN